MATRPARQRGHIEERSPSSFRVSVYAGIDPLTHQRRYLRETTATRRDAQKALTRLQGQVDDRRHPRTGTTMSELLEQWMEVSRHEASTADRYADLIRVYLLPTFGSTPAGKVDADLLEQFYGRLLRCRKLCSGTRRTDHECEPLAPNTVGKIHFIIRSAPGLGVRWRHLGVNEAEIAHRTPSCVRRYRRGTCAVLGSSSASEGWAAESKGRVVAEILVWTCGPVLRPATYSGCSHCTHSAALGRFG